MFKYIFGLPIRFRKNWYNILKYFSIFEYNYLTQHSDQNLQLTY